MKAFSGLSTRTQGIVLFLGTLSLFAFYDAFAKAMLAHHSPVVMNLSRYVTTNLFAMCWLWQATRNNGLRAARILPMLRSPALWGRSVSIAIVGTAFMGALVTMPLAEATAIYFTAPLLMVALSSRWLGERVSRAQWCAVWLGFAGMLCIVRPGGSLPFFGSMLMVLAACCYAVFQLLTRVLAGKIPPAVQFAHMSWICMATTLLATLAAWPERWPSGAEWSVLAAGALASVAGQLLMLAAYRRVTASTLGPLNYLQLLLALAISSWWFGLVPDSLALLGTVLIAASGLYLACGFSGSKLTAKRLPEALRQNVVSTPTSSHEVSAYQHATPVPRDRRTDSRQD
ncbi:DMT family transporter [Diaphorobacter sp. HDW4A]|uniref:DMT family transporter n=1 Tax=Diaphorobacter sp. HDW4A TaxID=2714924 RepID=UPI00140BD9CB|nr:DMT family transporter [Diaphorobacter sp. HDW4A]QIL79509.1 DMT family transporter [Diaphorobacter sp. HDW4A]